MALDDISDNGLIPLSKADGSESAVISVGPVSSRTHDLARENKADLFALCRIKPLPEEALLDIKSRYKDLTVVEDHQRAGGAFSAISELLSNLSSWAVNGEFVQEADRELGLREKYICCNGNE
jgi:transketolase C-terminal domain/subunit